MSSIDLKDLANIQNLAIELQVLRKLRKSISSFYIYVRFRDKDEIIESFAPRDREAAIFYLKKISRISSNVFLPLEEPFREEDFEDEEQEEERKIIMSGIYDVIEDVFDERMSEIERLFESAGILID